MRTVHFILRNLFVVCGLLLSFNLSAQSNKVDSIDIHVLLYPDGSASIHENWHIQIRENITEWYLVQGNLGEIEITDFSVSDETGKKFILEEEWDVDRSRSEKAGKCGIVDKGSDGYELCWGVGTSGAHTYSVSYKMSRLVKSYSDADGFNHMFVARGISPSPKQARLTIAIADTLFTQEDVHMWAFGFIGEIALKDGKIVAESSEPFRENSSMIALVQIKKGLLHPVAEAKGSFEKVKERAFEDSDYLNGNSDLSGEDIICIILMFGIPLGIILISKLCIYSRRRTLLGKSIDRADYRDLPENCSLLKANAILNYLSYLPRSNKYLFQAYMTDFFVRGILEVRTEKRRGGFTETCLKIHDWNDNGVEKEDGKIESLLYKMICKAADDEKILHANDLKKIKDKKLAVKLYGALTKKVEVSKNDHKEAKQLFGLKRYLERSTQINELSLSEMSLWKRHLVYAALLGCNKRAFKELERICPDITQLSQPDFRGKQKGKIPSSSFHPTIQLLYLYSTLLNKSSSKVYEQSGGSDGSGRSGGYGGSSSFGGGGGFSGGGYGGGGR